MKKNFLMMVCAMLVCGAVQAALTPLVNPSFEDPVGGNTDIFDWWDSAAYTATTVEDGTLIPLTPYGENWVQLGNGRWMYQQIGTYEENQTLNITFLIGQPSNKIVNGLVVELFAGGTASLAADVNAKRDAAAFPLDSVVGAVQIAASGNIDPFPDATPGTEEMSVPLSTGTAGAGYAVGDPLWLLFSRPSTAGLAEIDNVAVTLVPEPATMVLLGLGSLLLRKRK